MSLFASTVTIYLLALPVVVRHRVLLSFGSMTQVPAFYFLILLNPTGVRLDHGFPTDERKDGLGCVSWCSLATPLVLAVHLLIEPFTKEAPPRETIPASSRLA